MLKILLIEAENHVLGTFTTAPDAAATAPDAVIYSGRVFVQEPGAAFDASRFAAVYRPARAWTISALDVADLTSPVVERTADGAQMALEEGQTSDAAAEALASAARPR